MCYFKAKYCVYRSMIICHVLIHNSPKFLIMKISKKSIQNISIVNPVSNMITKDGSKLLRNAIEELLLDGSKNIIINLSGVDSLASTGIGELLTLNSLTVEKMGTLKLCCLNSNAMKVMNITNQNKVFEIFDTEQSAISSF